MAIRSFMLFFFFPIFFVVTDGSHGDRSQEHQVCLQVCQSRQCSSNFQLKTFKINQPWAERFTGWSCLDECKYNCMWETVKKFHTVGKKTPQFYGKWPFVRLLGMQEPASAIFSILNFGVHLKWIRRLFQKVPRHAPLFTVWVVYGLVSLNAWLWSTVFHTKDVDMTEKLDYFSAFSIVAYTLVTFCCRYFGSWTWQAALSACLCLAYFCRHLFLMTFVKFDYGYNMQVNIGVGIVNSLCWLIWSFSHRKTLPHAYLAASAIGFLTLSMVLEIFEFEPIFWTFDAHALWHLSTAPIHQFWYRFVIEDCLYQLDKTSALPSKLR